MIFVTTGTQLPFPRLIRAMDAIAAELPEAVVAQIGPDNASYAHVEIANSLSPAEFEDHFTRARVVVAHAGIGTILSARRIGKPLILVPRRYDMGEHRNDHQLATAKEVEGRPGLYIAWETEALAPLLQSTDLVPADDTPGTAYDQITSFLKTHIAAL